MAPVVHLTDESGFVYSPCALPHIISSFTPSAHRLQHRQVSHRRPQLHSIGLPVRTIASLSGPGQCGVDWLTSNNGRINEFLDFSKIDSRSRRCMTISKRKQAIPKGTELAEFPEGTYLTPAIAKTMLEKRGGPASDSSLNLQDESLFALCLLVERAKRSSSKYAGLLDCLPDVGELDSPDFWSDEELELLRGSPIYTKSMRIRQAIETEWKNLNSTLFEPNRKIFPREDYSLEMYKWALGIVDSRTLSASSDEPKILAPLLVNLRPPGASRLGTARVEMSGGMLFSKKRVLLRAGLDIGGGDEVTVSSEDGSYKSEYLLERGIVMKDGASKWEVSFQVSQLDRFYEDKTDILHMNGLGTSASFDMLEPNRDEKWEAPEKMESFVRLLCLSGADAFLLEGVFRQEVWSFMELPVSAENEKAMCELIIGTCEDALEEYSKGLETVEGAWGKVGGASRRRREMAESVVEGEKRIVKAALKTYKARMNSLDAVEYYAERRLKMLDLLRPVDDSEIVDSESGARIGRAFDENY